MAILNPYISFKDTARDAMEFYQSVLGGELFFAKFGDMGDPDAANAEGIMHSSLQTPSGFTLFASDTPDGMDYNPGTNIAISLSGSESEELKGYWDKLSDGATVTVPYAKQMWGDEFGMLIDKFGISWMVNVSPQG
ncbi:VOC family protein [Nocardioides baekrokdamisoli]|uniref:VOC family protein n=1 Tax=Nocardioides baekrokdamisoli TaxID=1804624 RepID=A0A3G9IIH2_9ACTN|nr:VOC family protein [Nocardioides baekrokdamisoli]BBH18156.1 VOC family protein [Nocardioides baekrokdamisoli]